MRIPSVSTANLATCLRAVVEETHVLRLDGLGSAVDFPNSFGMAVVLAFYALCFHKPPQEKP